MSRKFEQFKLLSLMHFSFTFVDRHALYFHSLYVHCVVVGEEKGTNVTENAVKFLSSDSFVPQLALLFVWTR